MPHWNHEADLLLLTAIVKVHKLKPDVKALVEELKTYDSQNMENVTTSALDNRFRKIKTGEALKAVNGSVPGTPTKSTTNGSASKVNGNNPKARPVANKKGIARPVKKSARRPKSEDASGSEEGDDEGPEVGFIEQDVKQEIKEKRKREGTVLSDRTKPNYKRAKVEDATEEDFEEGEIAV